MERATLLRSTYLFTFLTALHAFLFLYINSSILGRFFPTTLVGILFSFAALLSIPVLIYLPRALKKTGDVRLTVVTLILETVALFFLTYSATPAVVALAFLAHYILIRILFLDTDVILETLSRNATTGRIRGIYMTIGNTALVIAPLIVGLLLKNTDSYVRVFSAALVALIPAIILLSVSFKQFKEPRYAHIALFPALHTMWHHTALRRIFSANFILRIFYAVMVVYMGLYLHTVIAMPWEKIGIVFTVMLLPFALIEYPLGRIADTLLGEKEILIGGFILTAFATALLSWIQSDSVLAWSIVLLCTRIGASAVEIMTEVYFFKHVTQEDVELVSLYRIVEPAAYFVAPLLFSLLLSLIDMRFIFLTLGVIVLFGIWPAVQLRDTK
jgi:MFS family permease